MPLTTAQLTALRNDILSNQNTIPAGQPWTGSFAGVAVKDVPNSGDGNAAVAGWYGQLASPPWTTWKKLVSISEVGDKVNGGELAGLTSLNNTRLQTVVLLSPGGVNPSLADRRQFFDDIFSGAGGATTRGNLLALWKRLASYAQKLFSTGTGSDAAPATTAANIGDSFALTGSDVEAARNS
jgi:hypothetical protein